MRPITPHEVNSASWQAFSCRPMPSPRHPRRLLYTESIDTPSSYASLWILHSATWSASEHMRMHGMLTDATALHCSACVFIHCECPFTRRQVETSVRGRRARSRTWTPGARVNWASHEYVVIHRYPCSALWSCSSAEVNFFRNTV
jgi:hypothetical protein